MNAIQQSHKSNQVFQAELFELKRAINAERVPVKRDALVEQARILEGERHEALKQAPLWYRALMLVDAFFELVRLSAGVAGLPHRKEDAREAWSTNPGFKALPKEIQRGIVNGSAVEPWSNLEFLDLEDGIVDVLRDAALLDALQAAFEAHRAGVDVLGALYPKGSTCPPAH